MSAFEVKLTPTRIRNAKKVIEAREPTRVVLAPFSPKAIVIFEDVPVTKTARRFLVIDNPSDIDLKVLITKGFKPEFNVSLEWTSNTIQASSVTSLEIIWNPIKAMASKETLQLTDNRGFKKDVIIIFKSIDKKKNPLRPHNVPLIPKKMKLKSPSPPKHFRKKSSSPKFGTKKKRSPTHLKLIRSEHQSTSFGFREYANSEKRKLTPSPTINVMQNKENFNPKTPQLNASDIFNNIQFTPATETKTKGTSTIEYLSSLPTPISCRKILVLSPECETITEEAITDVNLAIAKISQKLLTPNRVIETPQVSKVKMSLLCEMATPVDGKQINKSSYSVISHHINNELNTPVNKTGREFELTACSTAARHQIKDHLIEENFSENAKKILFNCSPIEDTDRLSSDTYVKNNGSLRDSLSDIPLELFETATDINKTRTVSPGLGVINEEPVELGATFSEIHLQKTFNVTSKADDSIAKKVENIVTTPLRKIVSESLRDLNRREDNYEQLLLKLNQGSMPNLHEIDSINSIEKNRYYFQSNEKISDNIPANSTLSSNSSIVLFREHEICAQSSRFNLHEAGIGTDETSNAYCASSKQKTTVNSNFDTVTFKTPAAKRHYDITPATSREILRLTKGSLMALSPPKRSKFSSGDILTERASAGSQTNHFKKWSVTHPKKMKIPKVPIQTLVLKSKTITPRKEEKRIILFNSELYLQAVINPDPFAATTTCDPFLATTMYLDEKSVDRHEKQFKKWLNALVTIPAELDSINQKIDVGKLFNEVKNKELTLAPSKEVVSSKYFTKYRIDSLRKAAIQLYTSEEIRVPLSKLAVLIEKKQISVRDDRDLHLDLVLQRNILELLLCFNPLWLRIGLEVVFGEQIDLNSNSDVYGLTNFIINRLFKDKYLEAKYNKAFTYSASYSEQIKKFSLKMFLFLLLFLDQAKCKKIIKHNPCLFVKVSPYKETKEILARFSSHLVANIGDITKNLKRLGYVLTHKQTYLDEFDYAFNNLATDLRDGIRLTKVMEVILLRDDLSKSLRYPAISRLQKVHNVDLAMKALLQADYVMTGDITAKDIADGHREKTLSLLWQIIYKFRAPKFNAAATVIQQWWRNSWLKVVINRRIRQKHELVRHRAATMIQANFRGYMSRKETKLLQEERIIACIVIQANFRCFSVRRQYLMKHFATIHIQKWWRHVRAVKTVRSEFLRKKQSVIKLQRWFRRMSLSRKLLLATPLIREMKMEAKLKHEKAIILQRILKSYVIRKRLRDTVEGVVQFLRKKKSRTNAATKIQSFYKMWKCRTEFLQRRTFCIAIQRSWRRHLLYKQDRNQYLKTKRAVKKIQQYFRAYLLMKNDRKKFLQIQSCVARIQSIFRANRAMRSASNDYKILKSSAIVLQKRYRANLAMKKDKKIFESLKKSTLFIQTQFRANQIMKLQKEEFLSLKTATVMTQNRFRANQAMKRDRGQYLTLKRAVVTVQQHFRALLAMRRDRHMFVCLIKATIIFQRRYRAKKSMETEKNKFMELKNASIILQRRLRAHLLMRKYRVDYLEIKKASMLIQIHWRALVLMRQQRTDFLHSKKAAIKIQRRFRAQMAMKEQHCKYLQWKQAATIIQNKLRATQLMKKQRLQFINLQYYTTVVQQKYRANQLMKQNRANFLLLKKSALVLQRRYRALKTMQKQRQLFVNLKQSTIIMQQRRRANIACKIQKMNYLCLRWAIITVQRHYRAQLYMRKNRLGFEELKVATIKVQRQFRAQQAMKIQQKSYKILRKAALNIQHRFRANLVMKYYRKEYLKLQKSVIIIQRRFRVQKLMQTARKTYLQLKEKTICIQRQWKAVLVMRICRTNYLKLRTTVIFMQQCYRAKLAMKNDLKNYLELKKCIVNVQTRVRATIQARKERQRYLLIRKSTLIIQRKLIATLLMRQERRWFILLRESTICIQRHIRSTLEMRLIRSQFLLTRKSTIVIQQQFRAVLLRNQAQIKYQKLRQVTIQVQQRFRAQLAMRSARERYERIKNAILTIQTRFRAHQMMVTVRKSYLMKLENSKIIQNRFRAFKLMRLQRERFLQMKESAIIIQNYYKSYCLMKEERHRYQQLRNSAIIFQQSYRAKLVMKKIRNQYLLIRALIICIQRKYRAKKAMEIKRNQYLHLRQAVIFVQQKYRANIMARTDRQQYVEIKLVITKFQTHICGYLARQRFDQLKAEKLSPEALELQRKTKAAKKIQALWRGYLHRKQNQTKSMRQITENIIKLKRQAKPINTLRSKLKMSLKVLKGKINIQETLMVLTKMENMSRLVPHILIDHASFIASFCYGIMAQSIRSEPHKQLIELCACVVLNLARYEHTRENSFKPQALETVAQMLLRWCDKECGIFNTLCTLIWIFVHCPEKNEKIREFMTTHDAIYMLRETKKLVLRKEKMKQNVKRTLQQQLLSPMQLKQLPSLEPDYGVIKKQPYIFNCGVFAFDNILKEMKISLT